MKPTDDEVIDKFLNNVSWSDFISDEEILEFFEWAYNEGKKYKDDPQDENCTCSGYCKGNSTHKRKPTKMELATT